MPVFVFFKKHAPPLFSPGTVNA